MQRVVPLVSHKPCHYDLTLRIDASDSWKPSELVGISVLTDFSGHPNEPRDVIVLHADESINIDRFIVRTYPDATYPMKGPGTIVKIASACRDSEKQLLVLKLERELGDQDRVFKILMDAALPPVSRNDQLGLHKDSETGSIKADFSDNQARLIMPCFNDFKHEAEFHITLKSYWNFGISSKVLELKSQKMSGLSKVMFYETRPLRFDDLAFNLTIVEK